MRQVLRLTGKTGNILRLEAARSTPDMADISQIFYPGLSSEYLPKYCLIFTNVFSNIFTNNRLFVTLYIRTNTSCHLITLQYQKQTNRQTQQQGNRQTDKKINRQTVSKHTK